MPTLADARTALLDYVNRPASEMADQADRELNLVLLWMQRKKKFNFSERLIKLTYPANTLHINIADACGGRPRDFLNFQMLSSIDSTAGRPIKAMSYDAIMQEKFKFMRGGPALPTDFQDLSQISNDDYNAVLNTRSEGYVFFSGENIGLFPTPTIDKYILINLHIWLADLVEEDDTNFLLENCYDFVLLKALKRFNIYLKEEGRIPITNEEVLDGWESVLQWDSEVMMATPNTV